MKELKLIIFCLGVIVFCFTMTSCSSKGNPTHTGEKANYIQKNQFIIKPYIIDNHVFNDGEKKIVIEYLNGINIFEMEGINYLESGSIEIYCDEKDGKAWGNFKMKFDLSSEKKIMDVFGTLSEKINHRGNIIYFFEDKIGFLLEKKELYLVFRLRTELPYRYLSTEIDQEDKFVQYFLNLDQHLNQ